MSASYRSCSPSWPLSTTAPGLTIFLSLLPGFFFLISFGKHFPVVYGRLFDYLPFFNKFRVPVMMLHLLPFFVGILAAYGLEFLLTSERGKRFERTDAWPSHVFSTSRRSARSDSWSSASLSRVRSAQSFGIRCSSKEGELELLPAGIRSPGITDPGTVEADTL